MRRFDNINPEVAKAVVAEVSQEHGEVSQEAFEKAIIEVSEGSLCTVDIKHALARHGVLTTDATEVLLTQRALDIIKNRFDIKVIYSLERAIDILIAGLSLSEKYRLSAANAIIDIATELSRARRSEKPEETYEDMILKHRMLRAEKVTPGVT